MRAVPRPGSLRSRPATTYSTVIKPDESSSIEATKVLRPFVSGLLRILIRKWAMGTVCAIARMVASSRRRVDREVHPVGERVRTDVPAQLSGESATTIGDVSVIFAGAFHRSETSCSATVAVPRLGWRLNDSRSPPPAGRAAAAWTANALWAGGAEAALSEMVMRMRRCGRRVVS